MRVHATFMQRNPAHVRLDAFEGIGVRVSNRADAVTLRLSLRVPRTKERGTCASSYYFHPKQSESPGWTDRVAQSGKIYSAFKPESNQTRT